MNHIKILSLSAIMLSGQLWGEEKMPLAELVELDHWSDQAWEDAKKKLTSTEYTNEDFTNLVYKSLMLDDLVLYNALSYFQYRAKIAEEHLSGLEKLLRLSLDNPNEALEIPANFFAKDKPKKVIKCKKIETDFVALPILAILARNPSPTSTKLAIEALSYPKSRVAEQAIEYLYRIKYKDLDSLLEKWLKEVKKNEFKPRFAIYTAEAILDGEELPLED